MRKRVLIVHAAAVMRMIVKENLTANGFEVVEQASDGKQALEMYRAARPDVVTLDMVLPVMDGVATVRAIVAEFPSATIVMCASTGQPGTLVEALRAGAKSYVTKPFHGTQLIDVISKVLVA